MNEILQGILKDYKTSDLWLGSEYHKWQQLSNKSKGTVGERYVESLIREAGYEASFITAGNNEYDILADKDARVEVKLSFCRKDSHDYGGALVADLHTFQHIEFDRFDILALVSISPEKHVQESLGDLFRFRKRGHKGLWRQEIPEGEELQVWFFTVQDLEILWDDNPTLFQPQHNGYITSKIFPRVIDYGEGRHDFKEVLEKFRRGG